MDPIKTDTGTKEIPIERDGKLAGVITFNPDDVIFAEKFYRLAGVSQAKYTEYQNKFTEINKSNKDLDELGIPRNVGARIELSRDVCIFIREQIDDLFGAGTSQIAFGDTLSLSVFFQFFDGIGKYIQPVRAAKIAKYTTPASAKRNRRKVMK